jgi:hypothetical protein
VVKGELSPIVHTVGTRVDKLLEGGTKSAAQKFQHSALNALCQVELVAEVKALVMLYFLYHLYKRFVLRSDSCCANRDKGKAFDTKYVAICDVADQFCFVYDD